MIHPKLEFSTKLGHDSRLEPICSKTLRPKINQFDRATIHVNFFWWDVINEVIAEPIDADGISISGLREILNESKKLKSEMLEKKVKK